MRSFILTTNYKAALLKEDVYAGLPDIIGEMLVASATYDPCAENPIRCEEMAPAMAACYIRELGDERFVKLASGETEPLPAEQRLIQACFDQHGSLAADTNDEGGIPLYLKNLRAEDWAAVIRHILPPGELQTMTEEALDGVFAYLKGDAARAVLSLGTIKDRLEGATGDEVLRQLITAQPKCTDELIDLITGKRTMDELVLCNPPELLLPLALSTTRLMLNEAIATIPDEVVLLPPKGDGTGAADAQLWVRRARLIMFLSPLLPVLFLGLVTLFGVRSPKGWLRWWGIPFSITGGLAALGSLSTTLAWKPAWEKWVMPRFPAYLGENFSSLVRDLAGSLVNDLSLWLGLAGLLLLLLGIALWVGAKFARKKVLPELRPSPSSEQSEEKPAPEE